MPETGCLFVGRRKGGVRLRAVIAAAALFTVTAVAAASAASAYIYVFRSDAVKETDGVPRGWDLKEWRGKADVAVVETEVGRAIKLRSRATSTALYKDVSFDIRTSPYLSWRWKVTRLPEGADVRHRSRDDQAAQVYVIFPRWPAVINSRVIGYIWDTSAPRESRVTSTKTSNTRYIVIRSGSEGLGRWFRERRNVYEDYKRLFGEEPPPVGRVAVMIDSDDTGTFAEAFIADIYFARK
ncbi:MAG TPA: DUF3047 domain-containing protein [Deltaproteobacteria bacterium]|nr:DUF3047 domain-containing protein [Deltaproteobacteria bacterium]